MSSNLSPSELFDDIIHNIDADEVPLEYIIMAKVTDFNGNERLVRGDELATVMRGPERMKVQEARVILDVRKIRIAIAEGVNEIYDEVNRRAALEDEKDTDTE